MGKKYYWLKLPKDWFTSRTIKRLRKIAGGDTYTIIYLKMLLMSLADDGKLYYEGIDETFEEELALDLDEEVDNVKMTVAFLIKCGLLEKNGDFEYELPEIETMVGSSDSIEHKRELNAERQRRFRGKNKTENIIDSVTSNATVTQNSVTNNAIVNDSVTNNATVTQNSVTNNAIVNGSVTNNAKVTRYRNTEKEKEKEKENRVRDREREDKKEIEKKKAFFPLDDLLNSAFVDFIEYRKKIKKPLTDKAIQLNIKELEDLSKNSFGEMDNNKAINIINQTIKKGWSGFYPLKEEKNKNNANSIDWNNV